MSCARRKDVRQIRLSVRLRPFTGHVTIYSVILWLLPMGCTFPLNQIFKCFEFTYIHLQIIQQNIIGSNTFLLGIFRHHLNFINSKLIAQELETQIAFSTYSQDICTARTDPVQTSNTHVPIHHGLYILCCT